MDWALFEAGVAVWSLELQAFEWRLARSRAAAADPKSERTPARARLALVDPGAALAAAPR